MPYDVKIFWEKNSNEQSEDMFAETEKIIKAFQIAIENSILEKLVTLSSVGAQLESGTGPIIANRMVEQVFGIQIFR